MLQLRKSVRLAAIQRPFRQSLEVAAQLGATAVEIDARNEIRPQDLSQTGMRQIRKWLADYQLQVALVTYPTRRGFHVAEDLQRRIDGAKSAFQLAGQLNCRTVSLTSQPLPTVDNTESFSCLIEAFTDLANFSWRSGAWGAVRTTGDTWESYLAVMQRLPEHGLGIDFDPAAFAMNGQDAVVAMKNIGSRVMHFRARDASRDHALGRGLEVPLGRGTVDFPALLAALEEHQYQGFLTVDRQTTAESALVDLAQSFTYLENLFG
jgi:sugar phosphate isomerase/epimerase